MLWKSSPLILGQIDKERCLTREGTSAEPTDQCVGWNLRQSRVARSGRDRSRDRVSLGVAACATSNIAAKDYALCRK